jgi:hypothetical protein
MFRPIRKAPRGRARAGFMRASASVAYDHPHEVGPEADPAAGGAPDGLDDLRLGGAIDQVPDGSRLQHRGQGGLILICRQHDDVGFGSELSDPARRGGSPSAGHAHIHHHDLRPQFEH